MSTEEQKRIHDGLKEIGEEISNFYSDALAILDAGCKIASKANLVAHLAREIDGGMRDVFAPDLIKKELEKQYTGIENKGHFASIVAALGNVKNDKLVSEWFDIATRFAKIAHRHGPWKQTKPMNEIDALWKRYERVLLILVGSFYGIFDRLARISEMEEPTPEIIGTLFNILKNPKYGFHFFTRLSQPKWIMHLKDAGYFNPDNAPKKDVNEAYPREWFPMRYLLNLAKQHDPSAEKNIIAAYKKIREDYLAGKVELNPYTITIFAEILIELQTYSFTENDGKFFEKFGTINVGNSNWNLHGTYLSDQLPRAYLTRRDKNGLKNLLGYCFGFSVYSRGEADFFGLGLQPVNEILYLVEDYRLKEFVDNFGNEILLLLGGEAIEVAEGAVKAIHKIDSFKFSSSAIPSIEPSDQSSYSEEWETAVIRFITTGINLLPDGEVRSMASRYLGTPIDIFQRIAFHIMREKFTVMRDVFFKYADENKLGKIFVHEPYLLLKERSKLFSDEEFLKVIYWIENIEVQKYSEKETDDELQQHKYYQVRRWLSAMEPSGEKQMQVYHEKKEFYDSLNKYQLEHPAFDSYSSFTTGPDFPLTSEEFESKNVEEQIDYIKAFTPLEGHFHSNEGLAHLLKAAFINNPAKYLFRLDDFTDIPFLYLHDLVDGFTEVLGKEEITDINLAVDFLIVKFNRHSSADEKGKRFDYKRLYVYATGRFIETVARWDATFNFSQEQLLKMVDFIIVLLDQDEFKDDDDKISRDYINHILNSTQGRLHLALMSLSVAWAEKYPVSQSVKWPKPIKDYFTRRLDRTRQSDKDFSIVLGSYFSTLLYFDKNWCLQNLTRIFPDEKVHFEYTLSSCLSSYSKPYWDLFEMLKKASIINRALDLYNYNCGPLGSIMKYGLIEYNFKSIGLDNADSTLAKALLKKEPVQIEKLVEMTWEFKQIADDKLKPLWDSIFNAISSEQERYNSSLKSLIWFIDLIDSLTDEYLHRLLRSVDFLEENDKEAYSFIRSIFKLADTHLKNAGTLLLSTFRQTKMSPFMDDALEGFVEKLYKNDLNEIANNICWYVGDKGLLTLKKLYDNYNA